MKYRWQHFTGVDWDQKREKQAIYKVHAPHKDWASDVSPELGNYDYLMFANLDLSHPEVRNDLLKWGTWITQTLSLGGMRLDAAKHFSAQFQKDFAAHVRRTANPDLFVIGEYWTADVKAIEGYLDQVENTIVAYDVPLVERFSKISHIRHADLRGIFRDTLVQRRPDQAVVSFFFFLGTPTMRHALIVHVVLQPTSSLTFFFGAKTIVCNHDTVSGFVPDPFPPLTPGRLAFRGGTFVSIAWMAIG